MASTKQAKMAEFYTECVRKGYTDMKNPDQCLKAKVIAVDLNLYYGKDMTAFFEKAKQCHEQLQQELAQQQRRAAEEARRTAVNGELLATLSNGARNANRQEIQVFLRPDGSVYSTRNGGKKIEGPPAILVEKGGVLTYSFDPGKTVYTGATVGGIHMGGTHTTGPSYSEKMSTTGKGDVKARLLDTEFVVKYATMTDLTAERFRRDGAYKALVVNGRIRCDQDSEIADYMTRSALSGGNVYSQIQNLSLAADQKRLEYSECREIADLLVRIVCADFPPDDAALYAQAEALAQAEDSFRIEKAMEMFRSLSGYRDADRRAKDLRQKLEDAVQKEKEQAVLARERNRARAKWVALAVAVLLVLAAVFGVYQHFACRRVEEALLPSYFSGSGKYLSFDAEYPNIVKHNLYTTYRTTYAFDGWEITLVLGGKAMLEVEVDEAFYQKIYSVTLTYEIDADGNYVFKQASYKDHWGEYFLYPV